MSGTVTSQSDGETLIGVQIQQEGVRGGVITDIDGNYTITINGAKEAVLVFTYLGMQDQKHTVTAATHTLNVELAEAANVMDEVVVVAYGVRKKGTIAGSVSTVKSDIVENVPAASFDQALQGQSTGALQLFRSPVSQARLPNSRFAVPTPFMREPSLFLFSMASLFPVRISTH